MKISEMSKAIDAKATEILNILRGVKSHDLSSCLTGYDSIPEITYREYYVWESGEQVKKEHYKFSVEWNDSYDDFSESFSCDIPCEVIDSCNSNDIKKFFEDYFDKEFTRSIYLKVRDQIDLVKYSTEHAVVINNLDVLLANRELEHDKWRELTEPLINQEVKRRLATRFEE